MPYQLKQAPLNSVSCYFRLNYILENYHRCDSDLKKYAVSDEERNTLKKYIEFGPKWIPRIVHSLRLNRDIEYIPLYNAVKDVELWAETVKKVETRRDTHIAWKKENKLSFCKRNQNSKKTTRLLNLISYHLNNYSIDDLFWCLARNCKFFCDETEVISGKENICGYIIKRQEDLRNDKIRSYARPVIIENSYNQKISSGTNCIIIAQSDEANFIGFVIIHTNVFGNINRLFFYTTLKTELDVVSPDRINISKAPENQLCKQATDD